MTSPVQLASNVRQLQRDIRELAGKVRYIDDRRLRQKLPKQCAKSYELLRDDTAIFSINTEDEEVTLGFDGGTVYIKDTADITTDAIIGGISFLGHASEHIRAGQLEIDGDRLDIDWNPTNYTPDASPAEAGHVDHLTAHLKGIDDELGSLGGGGGLGGTGTDNRITRWNGTSALQDSECEIDDGGILTVNAAVVAADDEDGVIQVQSADTATKFTGTLKLRAETAAIGKPFGIADLRAVVERFAGK